MRAYVRLGFTWSQCKTFAKLLSGDCQEASTVTEQLEGSWAFAVSLSWMTTIDHARCRNLA